jgi:antimicrobial peptide system SdpB family protein
MLNSFAMRIYHFARAQQPWTNVYGVARTLLALSTMLTILSTSAQDLFSVRGSSALGTPSCEGWARGGLFCLMPEAHLEWARWLTIVVLLIVMSGWYPRWTAIFHWWVTWSFMTTSALIDGGDQLAASLTFLLLPIALMDRRPWHWSAPRLDDMGDSRAAARLVAGLVWLGLRLQVAYVYFQAGVAKFAVPEWADGTALYYWFTDPKYGADAWLMPLILPIVLSPILVTLLTWSVLVLEVFLAMSLVMEVRYRRWFLLLGFALHFGIGLIHGLASFATIMFAALILFLHPAGQPFRIPRGIWSPKTTPQILPAQAAD